MQPLLFEIAWEVCWQLGGIYKASSGQPFTPLLGGDPLGMKLDQTSEPPDRLVAIQGRVQMVRSGRRLTLEERFVKIRWCEN